MRGDMKEELVEAFVEASEIAVPKEQVEEAIARTTIEVLHRKRYEYMAKGRVFRPEDVGQFSEEIKNIAWMQVKTRLVLEDIIEKEGFEVSSDELEEEAKALAKRQQMTIEAVKGFLGEDMASLKDDILIRKAIDYITA